MSGLSVLTVGASIPPLLITLCQEQKEVAKTAKTLSALVGRAISKNQICRGLSGIEVKFFGHQKGRTGF